MAVQSSPGVQQTTQPIHGAIDRVACSQAAWMRVSCRVLWGSLPQLGDHLMNGSGPRLGRAPFPELRHPLIELCNGRGPVDVPDARVQIEILPTTVSDFEESV